MKNTWILRLLFNNVLIYVYKKLFSAAESLYILKNHKTYGQMLSLMVPTLTSKSGHSQYNRNYTNNKRLSNLFYLPIWPRLSEVGPPPPPAGWPQRLLIIQDTFACIPLEKLEWILGIFFIFILNSAIFFFFFFSFFFITLFQRFLKTRLKY